MSYVDGFSKTVHIFPALNVRRNEHIFVNKFNNWERTENIIFRDGKQ